MSKNVSFSSDKDTVSEFLLWEICKCLRDSCKSGSLKEAKLLWLLSWRMVF